MYTACKGTKLLQINSPFTVDGSVTFSTVTHGSITVYRAKFFLMSYHMCATCALRDNTLVLILLNHFLFVHGAAKVSF